MKFFACFAALLSAGLNTEADNIVRGGKKNLTLESPVASGTQPLR
jgi:hypothetical protein